MEQRLPHRGQYIFALTGFISALHCGFAPFTPLVLAPIRKTVFFYVCTSTHSFLPEYCFYTFLMKIAFIFFFVVEVNNPHRANRCNIITCCHVVDVALNEHSPTVVKNNNENTTTLYTQWNRIYAFPSSPFIIYTSLTIHKK